MAAKAPSSSQNRETLQLALAALLSGASWGLAWATMAPYLRSLGYTGTEYGLLGAAAVLLGAASSIAGGILSDIWGSARTASLGLSLGGLAYALIAAGTPYWVAAGFAVNGLSAGLGMTAMQALAARLGREERMHYTLSYYAAASTLGGALGSFSGWLPRLAATWAGVPLVDAYRYALLASGALSAAAGLAVLPARGPLERGLAGRAGLRLLASSVRGLEGRFYRIVAVEAVLGFGAAMSVHNIDYYFAAKYGVDSAQLGSVLGAQQLLMAALTAYLPRLSDRAGGRGPALHSAGLR
ncbi:MAG: MFS transporter [Desulfurococcales archaeon]|nr:MFS transporter [Desulfurococcales archaeon]